MNVKTITSWLAVLVGGCSSSDEASRIEVTGSNALGIRALETERVQTGNANVFTVHALSATEEIASVRITVGTVPALVGLVDGYDDQGSEIAIAIDGHERQTLSPEMQHILLNPKAYQEQPIEQLFEVDALSTVLEREANVFVQRPDAGANELAYAWSVATCSTAVVMPTPTAYQCCFWSNGTGTASATRFFRSDNILVERSRSPTHLSCRASDGSGTCNGQACTYGPNSFARPSMTPPNGSYPYMSKVVEYPYYDCYGVWTSSPQPHLFGDVVGTAGSACGCACDGTGRTCYDASREGTCPEANGLACNGPSPGTGCNPSGGSSGAAAFAY